MGSVEEIYQAMRADFSARTGMEAEEGCDLAARLYAAAAQVYALYVQGEWVTRQAFPQTAEGEYLDRHARLRGIHRKQAVEAVGRLRFWAGDAAQEERTVPAGTVCMTAGLVRFETTEPGVIPAGELSVLVPARALTAGTAGNAAAGTVTVMAVAPAGIARCGNPEPFSGGVDAEGDEALRARVLDTFLRLPNGVNAAFYQREALSFDQVAAAAVIPRPRGIGTVDIVAATQAGVPDEALLKELQEYFQSRREIAVEVRVRGPVLQEIDVALSVTAEAGRDRAAVQAAVEQAVRAWFRGERLGRDVLRAQLGDLVFHCGGVANYRITAPAADVAVGADVLPRLGTLKVEVTA